jgi:hypothetical protein
LKRKYTKRFPKKLDEVCMAQRRPEFRDIVDSSEFSDKKVPCHNIVTIVKPTF